MCGVMCLLSVADESSDLHMHAAASGESSTVGYYVVFSLIENPEGGFMFVRRGKSWAPAPCGRGVTKQFRCRAAAGASPLCCWGPSLPLFSSFSFFHLPETHFPSPIAQSHGQPMEFFVWNRKRSPSFQADACSLAGAEPGKQMVPLSTRENK